MRIALIVLDATRPDLLTPYGGEPGVTPNLDALANRGVTFTSCYAGAPWTPPSHATMFTGTYPSYHGVRGNDLEFPTGGHYLPEELRTAGIRTQAVGAEPWLSRSQGFARGFDRFHDRAKILENLRDTGHHRPGDVPTLVRAGTAYTRQALTDRFGTDRDAARFGVFLFREWASRDDSFTFVNIPVAHGPYRPPSVFREQVHGSDVPDVFNTERAHEFHSGNLDLGDEDWKNLRELYRAGLAHADYLVGRIVDRLPEDTWLLVTADHGEALGEHDRMRHQFSLYDEVLRVPLILVHPSLAPTTRDDVVSHVDIAPTCYDVLELEGRSRPTDVGDLPGRSLLAEPTADRTVYAEYGPPGPQVNALTNNVEGPHQELVEELYRHIRAAVTDEWKLISYSDGERELFRRGAEDENLAEDHPDVVERLHERLTTDLGDSPEPDLSTIDNYVRDDVTERLKRLGYL